MKKQGITVAVGFILYGLSVLVLVGLCAWRLINGQFDLVLILWTILWTAWFFVQFRRYHQREKDDEE